MKKQKNIMRLNLGCGQDIRDGYINMDKARIKGVDIIHDMDKYPWPFKANHFDEIFAQDVIEHFKNLIKGMNEIHRVCKKGATVRIIVPYWHSSEAFYPNHNYFFNTDSFKLFTEKNRSYDNFYGFKFVKVKEIPSSFGKLIPPFPVPKKLFPNVLNFRHLMSYILGEVIIKLDFEFKVVK